VLFFPLASLLHDRLLVALGASVTTVVLVALVAGLATGVAPSTVTGIGAGILLTVFGLAALAGVPAEETSQLSSSSRGRQKARSARHEADGHNASGPNQSRSPGSSTS
jgi:hypothetical protein